MKKIILLLFFTAQNLVAQEIAKTDASAATTDVLEVKPSFPGGLPAFYAFIQQQMILPEKSIKGKVFLTFIVEKDGSLSRIKIKNNSSNRAVGKEAIRVLKMSPRWIPGQQYGKNVRVKYSIPISVSP